MRDDPGLEARVEITEGICQELKRNRNEIVSHWLWTVNSIGARGGFKFDLNLAISPPPHAANHQDQTHFEPFFLSLESCPLWSYIPKILHPTPTGQ